MSEEQQRIVRVPGARRVRLTPVPGAGAEPLLTPEEEEEQPAASGPNDERMLREVPPHY